MSRIFTLEEARALMPKVKGLTEPAFELATSLAEELEGLEVTSDAAGTEALRERLNTLVSSWAEAVRDLGPDVKGLWLVDFDAGDGYWCWAYPEETLDHWHSYEGGFRSRVPVAERPVPAP